MKKKNKNIAGKKDKQNRNEKEGEENRKTETFNKKMKENWRMS